MHDSAQERETRGAQPAEQVASQGDAATPMGGEAGSADARESTSLNQ